MLFEAFLINIFRYIFIYIGVIGNRVREEAHPTTRKKGREDIRVYLYREKIYILFFGNGIDTYVPVQNDDDRNVSRNIYYKIMKLYKN